MDNMYNNLYTKNAITLNNNYNTTYSYSYTIGTVDIGKRVTVRIPQSIYEITRYKDEKVVLILNPIAIFELDETDLEFIHERIFKYIQFEIGGIQIDEIWMNQITVLQKKYNLEVKQIGSKVFFPLPINFLLKSNGIILSNCTKQEMRLWFEFSDDKFIGCIKNMLVRTELIILEKQPVWKNICEPVLNELQTNSIHSDKIKMIGTKLFDKIICAKPFDNFESKQITKIKQNQFMRMINLNENLNFIINCNFCHDIERFYIWFENHLDNIIYKEKSFDKISFIVDDIKVLELDYDDLVYNTLKINNNKGIGEGIYEIEWKNIINYDLNNFKVELNGLSLPSSDIYFNIYVESYNYLIYVDQMIEVLF
jgi:hypothetical protein